MKTQSIDLHNYLNINICLSFNIDFWPNPGIYIQEHYPNQNTLLIKVVTYASVMEKIPSVWVDLLEGVLKALPTSRLQF